MNYIFPLMGLASSTQARMSISIGENTPLVFNWKQEGGWVTVTEEPLRRFTANLSPSVSLGKFTIVVLNRARLG